MRDDACIVVDTSLFGLSTVWHSSTRVVLLSVVGTFGSFLAFF